MDDNKGRLIRYLLGWIPFCSSPNEDVDNTLKRGLESSQRTDYSPHRKIFANAESNQNPRQYSGRHGNYNNSSKRKGG